jgi:hypothetical protein
VTSLVDNAVFVIADEQGEHVDRIAVGANPEGMAIADGALFVANHGFGAGSTLTEVRLADLVVVAEHEIGCSGPRHLSKDAAGDIIVVCTGEVLYDDEFTVVGETAGSIIVFDPAAESVVFRVDVGSRLGADGPGQDAYMSAGTNALFVVSQTQEVLRFDATRREVTDTIGPVAGARIGAIGVDDASNRLYLGRITSYTSAGNVTVHDLSGATLSSFQAGIAPTFIDFWRGEQ